MDYGIDVVTDYKYVSGGDNWKNRIRNLIYESGYFYCLFFLKNLMSVKKVLHTEN